MSYSKVLLHVHHCTRWYHSYHTKFHVKCFTECPIPIDYTWQSGLITAINRLSSLVRCTTSMNVEPVGFKISRLIDNYMTWTENRSYALVQFFLTDSTVWMMSHFFPYKNKCGTEISVCAGVVNISVIVNNRRFGTRFGTMRC